MALSDSLPVHQVVQIDSEFQPLHNPGTLYRLFALLAFFPVLQSNPNKVL